MEIRKNDLIDKMAERYDITKTSAKQMIEYVSDTVRDEIAAGNNVILPRLVTFEVKDTAERVGRNPNTGEEITIKPNRKVVSKLSSTVKKSVKI